MELFTYFRSSAAYRVRIVLNLKGIEHSLVPVNLLKAEEQGTAYRALNPQGLVPSLRLADGTVITQSPAIIEYLDEQHPTPALLSTSPVLRAQQRALAASIACDVHPLNNLRVLKYLSGDLGVEDAQKTAWYAHWIAEGFQAIETQLHAAPYACGEHVSLADVYLVPQVFNALRFKVPMEAFPKIMQVYEACNQLPAFVQAAPENQPDNT